MEKIVAVDSQNSCKLAVNSRGKWTGEVKAYAETIESAVQIAHLAAVDMRQRIAKLNAQEEQ